MPAPVPTPARLLAVAVTALAAALPAPAHAAVPWAVTANSAGYVVSEVYVQPGDTLTLVNLDPTLSHDLVSLNVRNGVPRFRSTVLAPGGVGEVAHVSELEPNVYPFYCQLHEYMQGNLHVGLDQ